MRYFSILAACCSIDLSPQIGQKIWLRGHSHSPGWRKIFLDIIFFFNWWKCKKTGLNLVPVYFQRSLIFFENWKRVNIFFEEYETEDFEFFNFFSHISLNYLSKRISRPLKLILMVLIDSLSKKTYSLPQKWSKSDGKLLKYKKIGFNLWFFGICLTHAPETVFWPAPSEFSSDFNKNGTKMLRKPFSIK